MSTEALHMRIGSNLGEILLDIAQNNIKTGNILEIIGRVEKRYDKYQVIVNNVRMLE